LVYVILLGIVLAAAYLAARFWPRTTVTAVTLTPDGRLISTPSSGLDFLSNLARDAKAVVQGGIGVALARDSSSGLPKVGGLVPGSPAAVAGLQVADIIVQVNGKPVAGVPFPTVVEQIRGFRGTSVQLGIQRLGSTNPVVVTVRRASFRSLGIK